MPPPTIGQGAPPPIPYPDVPLPASILGQPPPGGPRPTVGTPSPAGVTQTPAAQAAGSLPNVATVRASAAQSQPLPDTGLMGRVKAGLAKFAAALKAAFSHPPAPPPLNIPPQVVISCARLPGPGGVPTNVVIDSSQYEQMIMSMPKSERPTAVAGLQTTLAGRIDRGLDILGQVRAGTFTERATPKNVSDMMLALYAIAASKNEAFTNGSFQVVDRNGRFAAWLDDSPDVYLRSSSHLKAYQGDTIDNHVNMQRGIDIPEGVDAGLPNGHKTLVYGSIPGHPADPSRSLAETPRRIFLKTESAGCRISTVNLKDNSAAMSQGMKIRDIHASDIPEAVRHGLSFLQTRGQQGVASARKEHFPAPLAKAYENAVKDLNALIKRKDGVSPFAKSVLATIEQGRPASGGGVYRLRENLDFLRYSVDRGVIPPEVDRIVTSLAQTARDPSVVRADHPTIRLGNEFIVD